MSDSVLDAVREIIQEDVGARGLRSDAETNLVTACRSDFEAACRSVAGTRDAALAVVTGFLIPDAGPPSGETDGPLGAVFLARALLPLGIPVTVATDGWARRAVEVGLGSCGLAGSVRLVELPAVEEAARMSPGGYRQAFQAKAGRVSHLVALERVGPSHTPDSAARQAGAGPETRERFEAEVGSEGGGRCYTMRGRDVTGLVSPAHWLFEGPAEHLRTIGIGDGGNEIGMGKVPWDVIRRNIPGGARVACRVATDWLVVTGVSNWGAYGLAAGVAWCRGERLAAELFDAERERELLSEMVEKGPLVDGRTGVQEVSVDGLAFDRYARTLEEIGRVLGWAS